MSRVENIQRLNIVNIDISPNDGIVKLIEVRKNLKYFEYLHSSNLNVISSIIENCGGRLKKILFRPYDLKEIRRDFKNSKLSINRIESLEEITENGGTLLKIFINSAPTNLKELRFFEEFKFSLENLEEFLGKWKGCPFSILTCDSLYESEDYKKLIDKYKNNGIIKEFRYEIDYRELINSFIVL
ncbi:hypothetical protein GLOIN_2v1765921 [Rhizophagus irregularis DAOM 181602=DAOM 197198]|nr:hypothetical protein GLOIN_2v1765921 [Rhizophagus irregularis DAOM 181602=DAOM 197198]